MRLPKAGAHTDFTGSGQLDIISRPWSPKLDDDVGGSMFVVFLENISEEE